MPRDATSWIEIASAKIRSSAPQREHKTLCRQIVLWSLPLMAVALAGCLSVLTIGFNKLDVRGAKGKGKFIQGDNGGISTASFKAAEILLTESGACLNLFLSQAFFPTQASEVPANQFAHVHAQTGANLHTISL